MGFETFKSFVCKCGGIDGMLFHCEELQPTQRIKRAVSDVSDTVYADWEVTTQTSTVASFARIQNAPQNKAVFMKTRQLQEGPSLNEYYDRLFVWDFETQEELFNLQLFGYRDRNLSNPELHEARPANFVQLLGEPARAAMSEDDTIIVPTLQVSSGSLGVLHIDTTVPGGNPTFYPYPTGVGAPQFSGIAYCHDNSRHEWKDAVGIRRTSETANGFNFTVTEEVIVGELDLATWTVSGDVIFTHVHNDTFFPKGVLRIYGHDSYTTAAGEKTTFTVVWAPLTPFGSEARVYIDNALVAQEPASVQYFAAAPGGGIISRSDGPIVGYGDLSAMMGVTSPVVYPFTGGTNFRIMGVGDDYVYVCALMDFANTVGAYYPGVDINATLRPNVDPADWAEWIYRFSNERWYPVRKQNADATEFYELFDGRNAVTGLSPNYFCADVVKNPDGAVYPQWDGDLEY